MPMIQVESVTKRYGATLAVDDISFSVEKGEIVGFLGPNGAGKSTTMRILTGSLGATDGRVLVGGHDVVEAPRQVKSMLGYLPEHPPLYLDMSVRDYLRFCARMKRVADPKAAVERVVGKVGIENVAHRIIGHLSKGYRQRVGLAQALVHDPTVLVLDEPASGLDPGQRVEIRDLVKDLAGGEVTVVLSTHVLPEVEAICDRVIIISRGRIVAKDSLEGLTAPGSLVVAHMAPGADMPSLAASVGALDGVEAVEAIEAVIRVRATADVRAAVARLLAPHGLLELRSGRGLEEEFLRLTREG